MPPYLDTFGGWIGASWHLGAPAKIDALVSRLVVVGLVVLSVFFPSRVHGGASDSQNPSGEQLA